ncbi:MAG: DUF2786 domain-containing protein [Chlamydiia bacterium]|nr:DUF2786 domain-containing protein [Chlamydiia bacterium]
MNILYSTTILAFLSKVKHLSFQILREEMGLGTARSRFTYKGLSFPLHFVVFDHPSKLGFYSPDLYEIGINKVFLLEKEERIKEILRHELAHMITFIDFGKGVSHHGKEFRSVCERFGWPKEVSKATVHFEKVVKNQRLVQKVQKLLSLANSPNPAEAREATLKAQELVKKYHLNIAPDEEETVLIRVLEKKRGSAKLQAIASILRTFLVYPVFNRGKEQIYLEITGSPIATEVAEYVAHFLDHHFEVLWKEAQKEDPSLKGTTSKNSFFRGLADGYQNKNSPSKALIKIENQLTLMASKIYPHLRSVSSSYDHVEKGAKKGREKGQKLKIHGGLMKGGKGLLKILHQCRL